MEYIPTKEFSVPAKVHRQRKNLGDIAEFAESIRSVGGIFNPIIAKAKEGKDKTLYIVVAGERRFRAYQHLQETYPNEDKWKNIPTNVYHEGDKLLLSIIEYAENVDRKDLEWTERCLADLKIHRLLEESHKNSNNGGNWSIQATADHLGRKPTDTYHRIIVAQAMEEDPEDKQLSGCSTYRQAYNIIERRKSRRVDDAVAKIAHQMRTATEEAAVPGPTSGLIIKPPEDRVILEDEVAEEIPLNAKTEDVLTGSYTSKPRIIVKAPEDKIETTTDSVLNMSWHEFARQYTGVPFNFMHCDFPYGIDHDKSDQGGSAKEVSYADNEKVYWDCIDSLLENVDRILTPSCQILFWFSMKYYSETLDRFASSDFEIYGNPVIWHKTDGVGIASRPDVFPRHSYETALWMVKGGRKTLKVVNDIYGAPVNRSQRLHQSEKPVPMLKHFFQMAVDTNTRMIDPTCGAGSSLRAAVDMGAESVLGIELNPEHAATAQKELEKFKWKKQAYEGVKK